MTGVPVPLTAAYSHLFRGVRLSLPREGVDLPLGPGAVRLAFSDGVEVDAELLATAEESLVLSVPSYRTSAGHAVDAALWPVLDVTDGADADQLSVRLGPRIV
ncbi:MAG: hypothetical protein QM582_14905 [Micropruina sp.]|uniref:hypothetical protein n=1 Tax=Micropruina sp. TaxID=2737536 RepID=UPI0039E45300